MKTAHSNAIMRGIARALDIRDHDDRLTHISQGLYGDYAALKGDWENIEGGKNESKN